MEVVTGDRYLESLVKFVEKNAGQLIDGSIVLKLNPVGLHYVYSRLDALSELERLISGAPVDYLRAYISDLGDHRAIEQLRRILCRLSSLKVVSVLPPPARDPTPLSLLPFGRLKVLELRGCDLSTSAARGLLELRHTLEKLVCHNSTDALRHIFASRISEIKDSPQWNHLSFVSCACNRLVLMDESLQLLPAVEILDLSRNKFAKVDNLRICAKLVHLDLGFNQLRSVAPFREVTCNILKLVLRNNSLTTLKGIENLKSLEGLDLSYNIISSFPELEILSSLPALRNLWLEGNPFCCARWYRPQVFSYFPYPDKVKLDDKEISTREFWKRQIVIARRQTRPASYGFYFPAREDTEEEALLSTKTEEEARWSRKTKKVSRLASIVSDDRKRFSDQDSISSGNEIHSGDEKAASVDEPEVAGLINTVEVTKKEPSIYLGDISKGSMHASNYNASNILEPESFLVGVGAHQHRHHMSDPAKETHSSHHGQSEKRANAYWMQDNQRYENTKEYQLAAKNSSHIDLGAAQVGNNLSKAGSVKPTNVVNEMLDDSVPFNHPRSPPQYQEDIIHRLHDLEEEILQLSAESFSVISSESDTSSSEDEAFGHATQFHDSQTLQQVLQGGDTDGDSLSHSVEMINCQTAQHSEASKACGCSFDLHSENVCDQTLLGSERSLEMPHAGDMNEETNCAKEVVDNLERMKHKRKVKKRVVPLSDEDYVSNTGVACETETYYREYVSASLSTQRSRDVIKDIRFDIINNECVHTCTNRSLLDDHPGDVHTHDNHLEKCVEHYFNSVIGDSGVHEICRELLLCTCIVEQETQHEERDVFVVLSSEGKLYSVLANAIFYGSGSDAGLISSYKVEDVSDILVGLGLQLVRVHVAGQAALMYITKSAEKSRHFLSMLEAFSSAEAGHHSSLRSLECVQIDLFDKKIRGHSEVGIYQYSMVLFTCNDSEGAEWISRSLFVCQRHLFVCIENVKQFSSLSDDAASSDYFLLDSSCCITDVSELVIEEKGRCSVTLKLEPHLSESCLSGLTDLMKLNMVFAREKSKTWRFKWLSEATLLNFVTLFKAIHAGMATSALSVKCVS